MGSMLLFAWIGVMVVCSAWLYVAERGRNKAVDNPFEALWWGVVTLTTVGYGDVTPVTTEGRIAAMVLMLLDIGLFGAITATITSCILSTDLRRMKSKVETDVVLDQTIERRTAASAESTSSASGTLVSDLERLAALTPGWKPDSRRIHRREGAGACTTTAPAAPEDVIEGRSVRLRRPGSNVTAAPRCAGVFVDDPELSVDEIQVEEAGVWSVDR